MQPFVAINEDSKELSMVIKIISLVSVFIMAGVFEISKDLFQLSS